MSDTTRLLKIRLLDRIMLLRDWSHSYKSSMVVIMNSWIFVVFPSAPWKPICSTCHSFPILFRLPRTWLFMSNSVGVSKSRRRLPYRCMHLVHAPSFQVAHLLCFFVRIIFIILCPLQCESVFPVWLYSLDYTILIFARILVPLITLSICFKHNYVAFFSWVSETTRNWATLSSLKVRIINHSTK